MGNTAIKYILKWSNEIDDIFLDDFLNVENAVFGGFSKQIFEQKIINNIYLCLIMEKLINLIIYIIF